MSFLKDTNSKDVRRYQNDINTNDGHRD